MSAAALNDWLSKYRPDLRVNLLAADIAGGVALMNSVTGLNLKPSFHMDNDSMCAKYLSELKKGGPMAMSKDEYLREMANQQAAYARHPQLAQLGAMNPYLGDGARTQAGAPTPEPQPEPNKVLLLLGEDE